MAELKTKPHTGDVDEFIEQVPDPIKREDSRKLIALMTEVSGAPAVLWGTMIGFGQYHYRYASGHEGDAFIIGFAPRKAEFSLYLLSCHGPEMEAERDALLARLGKHRAGKACLYVKRLADIDMDVLRQLAVRAVEQSRRDYPQNE